MTNTQRIILTRIVTGFILCFFFLRFIEHTTASSLLAPPLFAAQLDITYWAFQLLHLPGFLIYNQPGAILFDFLLFLSGVLAFIFPLTRKWIIFFTILVFLQAISFNSYGMHHTHSLAGFMIVLFPFWIKDSEKFNKLWQGVRYYVCFIYSISFIWKAFVTQVIFNWEQGIATFKPNLVEYLYHNPEGLLSGFYRWCISNAWFLNTGNLMVVLLEGIMLIGFFTKKWDRALFWIPVIIHLATFIFADVLFFELLVLDFSLLSLLQLEHIGKKNSGLTSALF